MSSIRIGIISTMGGNPWGGSEELWAVTALEALDAGYEVFVSVLGWANTPPKVAELERRGAQILRRHNPDCQVQGRLFGAAASYRDLFNKAPTDLLEMLTNADFVCFLRDLKHIKHSEIGNIYAVNSRTI